jgi:hypothetical protein
MGVEHKPDAHGKYDAAGSPFDWHPGVTGEQQLKLLRG